jgi:hypothetical protein
MKRNYKIPFPEQISMVLIRGAPIKKIKKCLALAEEKNIPVSYLELEWYYSTGGDSLELVYALIRLKDSGISLSLQELVYLERGEELSVNSLVDHLIKDKINLKDTIDWEDFENKEKQKDWNVLSKTDYFSLLIPTGIFLYGLFGVVSGNIYFGKNGNGFTYTGAGAAWIGGTMIAFAISILLLYVVERYKRRFESVFLSLLAGMLVVSIFITVPAFLYFMFIYYGN